MFIILKRRYITIIHGKGQAADVGDESTRELLSSAKFQKKHNKITTEDVLKQGRFSVDLTAETFHIGHTNVNYVVRSNGNTSSVTYTLFSNDGFWDPDFLMENGKLTGIHGQGNMGKELLIPDGVGPNLEFGGTPYYYKTRTRTYFFKPIK